MDMKYLLAFLMMALPGMSLFEGGVRMFDVRGLPVMDLWEPPNPGYFDRKYPPVNSRSVELKPIEFNGRKFLQSTLILACEEWVDAPSPPTVRQGAFLDVLSSFYPKKEYDEANDRKWTDIQDYGLFIYTYFTMDGKICELDDQGYHMRVVEENRGRNSVTFYNAEGEECHCADGYHRGDVIQQAGWILHGPFVFKESFFGKAEKGSGIFYQEPVDVERPAIYPKGRTIRYHQYKATPAPGAGVACLEVHKGWEAEVTASTRKTFYLKGRFGYNYGIDELRMLLPEKLLQARFYLDPYDVAEAEYTDKFGRLTRGLQGWARRCADHYEPGSDLGGGRAVKEIRYYDQHGELSSDHRQQCAIIRFSYPENGVQQISYFDEHGRELKHLREVEEGPLEKNEFYACFSMINEDVTAYEGGNRYDDEEEGNEE